MTAIETAAACSDFVLNLDELEDIQLYEASVETALQVMTGAVDTILLDPPRAGLSRRPSMGCSSIARTASFISRVIWGRSHAMLAGLGPRAICSNA